MLEPYRGGSVLTEVEVVSEGGTRDMRREEITYFGCLTWVAISVLCLFACVLTTWSHGHVPFKMMI